MNGLSLAQLSDELRKAPDLARSVTLEAPVTLRPTGVCSYRGGAIILTKKDED